MVNNTSNILQFLVEISTTILLCNYSEHLWSDEQEHTHNRIKSFNDSGKGYRTIAKLLTAEGSRTEKNKEEKLLKFYILCCIENIVILVINFL